MKAQNIGVKNFGSELEVFKSAFSKNCDLASRWLQTEISEIDKSTGHLYKVKEVFLEQKVTFVWPITRRRLLQLKIYSHKCNHA